MEERVYSSEYRGVRRRAAWALLTVLMLFGAVEATLRLAIGPPPLPMGVARTQSLRLVQVGGGWVAAVALAGQDAEYRALLRPYRVNRNQDGIDLAPWVIELWICTEQPTNTDVSGQCGVRRVGPHAGQAEA